MTRISRASGMRYQHTSWRAYRGSVARRTLSPTSTAPVAKEFLDSRRKQPTPYMEKLRFTPGTSATDPDTRMLSDEQLEQAEAEGKRSEGG